MKPRYHDITMRLWLIQERIRRGKEEPPVIVPDLNEDLSHLNEAEVRNEIAAVRERLELGHVEPEGVQGLNYRLHRLMAQAEVVRKKERKM